MIREVEDPAGYDPVAAGLKGQSLSIRVYARGPVARDARQDPAFERKRFERPTSRAQGFRGILAATR